MAGFLPAGAAGAVADVGADHLWGGRGSKGGTVAGRDWQGKEGSLRRVGVEEREGRYGGWGARKAETAAGRERLVRKRRVAVKRSWSVKEGPH